MNPKTVAVVLVIAAALVRGALADPPLQSYDLAADIPTPLASIDYTTNQVVRRLTGSAYVPVAVLPSDVAISAVERRAFDGAWLFSTADPWTFGANTFLPNDVVSWNGVTFNWVLQGAAAGIPADIRIDAIAESGAGALELSFDAPVRLGSTDYDRSDLVLWAGGVFSLAWSGGSAGVPATANLVGASRDAAGDRLLAFDDPVTLGGADYLPGDVLRWASGGFSLASHDADWPKGAGLRDFTATPAVGGIPASLTLSKSSNHIVLTWGAACGATVATDYTVHEGTIGSWYSHTARYCSTNGQQTSSFVPPAGNKYYLIAARNGPSEGSYGTNTRGAEIPPSPNACAPQQLATCP